MNDWTPWVSDQDLEKMWRGTATEGGAAVKKGKTPSEEVFMKDVANHEIHVLLDNGVYRHLRFKQPNSSNAWL